MVKNTQNALCVLFLLVDNVKGSMAIALSELSYSCDIVKLI